MEDHTCLHRKQRYMLFKKRKTYHPSASDAELLELFKKSNNNAIIGEYYQRYGHLVMGTCMKYMKNKMDAEDVVMIIFEKLPGRLHSHDVMHFKSWLYMVTKNECLILLRKKGLHGSELPHEIESSDELAMIEAREVQLNILEQAVSELKELQRQCIDLFYLQRKSYQEISEALQLDVKKVKSAIQNGKRNLKIKLEASNEFKSAI